MKALKILAGLLFLTGMGMAQSTTTTTTTTTENNQAAPASVEKKEGDVKETTDHPRAYIGVRFLPTFTSVNVHQVDNGNVKSSFVLGYGFGGIIGYNFSKHIGIQAEVLYSSLSQRYTSGGQKQRLDLSYINIPLLLTLNTNSFGRFNLNVVAGPQIGINTGSRIKTENGEGVDTVQAIVAVKPADLGIAYGAGVDFGITNSLRLGVGFRGVLGLLDISDNNKTATTNQYYILDRSKVKTYSAYIGLSLAF